MGRRRKREKIPTTTIGIIFHYLHKHVQMINSSKLFAGLMIITLNIVSKFVNIKLSKTLEAYLKFTFSKQILVFAIAWMGTRDIYVAFVITGLFIIFTEYLFHEDSMFFMFPEDFKEYHISLLENENNKDTVTAEDVKKAREVLEKAKKQGLDESLDLLQGYNIR
jgi:hypothetical protein